MLTDSKHELFVIRQFDIARDYELNTHSDTLARLNCVGGVEPAVQAVGQSHWGPRPGLQSWT